MFETYKPIIEEDIQKADKSKADTPKDYHYTRERNEPTRREDIEDPGSGVKEGMALRQLEAFEEYTERIVQMGGELLESSKGQAGVEKGPDSEYVKKLKRLVERIFAWVRVNGLTPLEMRRLAGGFKNPVLLITTKEGKQFVAKAFMEEEAAEVTDRAKDRLSKIAGADQEFIPQLITWLDDESIVSEKAEGFAMRIVIEKVSKREILTEKAQEAFLS